MPMQPPTAVPSMAPAGLGAGPPAGASPQAGQMPGNMGQMLAALTQRAQSGQLPQQAIMILTFLAGMGMEPFSRVTDKLRGPKQMPGKNPVQADAMRASPGMAVNPQIAQLLARVAAARQGGASGMPGMPVAGATGMPAALMG